MAFDVPLCTGCVLFVYGVNCGTTEDVSMLGGGIGVWLSLCSRMRMRRRLCWNYQGVEGEEAEAEGGKGCTEFLDSVVSC